jgi:rRNA processing protein Gar1
VFTLLIIVLLVSVFANVYLAYQNVSLSSQAAVDATRVEMTALLSAVQSSVDSEIARIGNSVVYASQQLTNTGISGDQARQVISVLAGNSSYIIEAATQNLNRVMTVVEPEAYHKSEGQTLGPQKWLNPNPVGDITPAMTPVIMLITNQSGCSIVAPVFDSNKVLIGTVSSIFDPQAMIDAAIKAVSPSSGYSFTVSQLDGLVVYSGHPDFKGKNLFTDESLAANYPGVRESAQVTSAVSSGYHAYSVGTQQREAYWTTISAYGQQWRLVIHHAT